MSSLVPLPPAPDKAYDPDTFAARVGAYAGFLHEVRWGYYKGWLHGQVRRALVRTRWLEAVVHAGAITLVVRLEDDGLFGAGRVLVFDRARGTVREFERPGVPLRTVVVGPCAGEGARAYLRAPDGHIELTRSAGASAWHLAVRAPGLRLELELDTRAAPRPSMVVGHARPPFAHRPGLTQRAACLGVRGTATVGSETLDLRDAVAELSYTNVFLTPFVRTHGLSALGTVDGRPAALAWSGGDLLGGRTESTLFVDGVPYGVMESALDETFTVRGPGVDLRFVEAASHGARASRLGGSMRRDGVWKAGVVSGTVPLPGGRSVPIAWPAVASSHVLVR